MAEALIDGTGNAYAVGATASNELKVAVTSGTIAMSGVGLNDFTLRYSHIIDYGTGTQPVYLGLASPGTATSSAGWQIRKNNLSGGTFQLVTSVLFASGNNNFDKIWDDRISAPYS